MASPRDLAALLKPGMPANPALAYHPALTGAEQYGGAMEPAQKPDVAGLVQALGPSVASRMQAHGDAQRARMAAGDYSPTALTDENIALADDVAGGLLGPMGLAGIIESIPAPAWNRAARSLEVGINPTRRELSELFKQEDTLRVLMNGDQSYFWPASQALHDDIGAAFKLDPKQTRHGLVGREQFR